MTMTLERAKAIVLAEGEARKRWGRLYTPQANRSDLFDALPVLAEALHALEGQVSPEDHLKLKRQLTASQAREAKCKKRVEQLLEELDTSFKLRDNLAGTVVKLEAEIANSVTKP